MYGLKTCILSLTDISTPSMATSSKIPTSSTSPKHRGWLSSGRKLQVIPSKSPGHLKEDEVYSTGPSKQMRQVRKSKSEKGKMKTNASFHDLGVVTTKWHISLPNIHDTQESVSSNVIVSPKRRPIATSPLPPPPTNPPPVLNQVYEKVSNPPRERELVKSISAGAINLVTPVNTFTGKVFRPQDAVVAKVAKGDEMAEGKGRKEGEGRHRKGPPPKLPPPYSPKTRAAVIVSTAIQDQMQSSTRSAPGQLQESDKSENSMKLTENEKISSRMRSESSENALLASMGSDETQDDQSQVPKPQKLTPNVPLTAAEAQESQLTSSIEGGVKSLARYFSARSKEGSTASSASQKHTVLRQEKGRKVFKDAVQKHSNIPEMCMEETGSPTVKRTQSQRPPPIPSISEDPDEKYEVLRNVGSMVSTGSPTHMSLFSWYNPTPDSKFGKCGIKRYQNVFDDKAFACFDKRGIAEKEVSSPATPYKEYQNVLVDTATLESHSSRENVKDDSDAQQSDREGSHKEKKPKPLPRTQSKEREIRQQNSRGHHLSTSDSEGSLSVPSPRSARSSEYVDMAAQLGSRGHTERQDTCTSHEEESVGTPGPPDMIVLGALDPEWREKYEELIEMEIEMAEEFSESEEFGRDNDRVEAERNVGVPLTQDEKQDIVCPLPFVPVKKVSLMKSHSHNLHGPNIHRRNTPKERRELRKGVCSDSDDWQSNEEPEIDDYISMKSSQLPQNAHMNYTPLPSQGTSKSQLTSSLTIPKPVPGMDPHSSTYYLKILPNETPTAMVKPVEQASTTSKIPTRTNHYYIEIDVPADPSEEVEPKKSGKDTACNPTLPPKPSPTHKIGGASVVAVNTKRKLKYSKVNVAPSTDNTVTDKRAGTKGKIPYSRVKVNSDTVKVAIFENGSHPAVQSQGSIFAKEILNRVDRPLPPTPSEKADYYKTVHYPIGHVPVLRQVWHHEYTEIDENELKNKVPLPNSVPVPKAAEGWINIHAVGGPVRVTETKKRSLTVLPPPIPKRPSCPYVEIDGEKIEEMGASLPPSVLQTSQRGVDTNQPGLKGKSNASLGPKAARKLGPPPAVPGRPGLQRSFSSSSEYAYPVIPGLKFEWLKMQQGENQAYFSPRVPLPATSHPTHHNTANGKKSLMATITEVHTKVLSDHPPSLPPKTESLLREQGLLASSPTKPSPYLVPISSAKTRKLSAPEIYTNLVNPAASPEHQKLPKEVLNSMRKELLGDTNRRGEANSDHQKQRKKATYMYPPRPPPPYILKSAETKAKSSSHAPEVPKKQRKVSREEDNYSLSAAATALLRHPDKIAAMEEGSPEGQPLPPNMLTVRKTRLQHRIDRNSLAMIMRNKDVIVEQLQKESGSPKSQGKPSEEDGAKQDQSVVRSLGDILLEVDSLLQSRMCSEDDVIAAIEKQLNIKLVKKGQGSSDEEQREDESEQRQTDGNIQDDSIQVTQQDVEEVVTFMNKNQQNQTTGNKSPSEITAVTTESGQGEEVDKGMEGSGAEGNNQEDEMETFSSPKRRTSTFVVNNDVDLIPFSREKNVPHHITDSLTGDQIELSPERNAGKSQRLEEDILQSTEERMRDTRSSSIGLKPLRRAKARRKTNPASDMVNLSSGKCAVLIHSTLITHL